MEMSTKKDYETRRHLLAVAIFFSVNATTAQASVSSTISIEGLKNQFIIPKEKTIQVNSLREAGILISSGRGNTLNIFGNVLAKGNAVEFNFIGDELKGALVEEFNLWGSIKSNNRAIYIGEKSFVKEININKGASLAGDIVSAWKPTVATDVTNLNFNADINYTGNISGADNIKMHVKSGTLNFSGSAKIHTKRKPM